MAGAYVTKKSWDDFLLSKDTEPVWELFHENSKIGRHAQALSDDEVLLRMSELEESLVYKGYPCFDLPDSLVPLNLSLEQAIATRSSIRDMTPSQLSLPELGTLLHYAYGVTQPNRQGKSIRPFRAVPSGGGLYPLEIFFHTTQVTGLESGLYHYHPTYRRLRLLRNGDDSARIAESMLQPSIALGASLIIFLTALFQRSVFKYGDRGYRYAMFEAGHVAQNVNLVCKGLGLGCVNLGGFYDREIDEQLELDGLTHSTIYIVAVGKENGKT
jgi:SagB-type dehydrogenase family enzyme